MKNTIITLSILFFSLQLFAQTTSTERYVVNFQTEQDYEQAEESVKEAINWLLQTPFNENITERKQASKFVYKWITGAPHFSLDIAKPFSSALNAEKLPYSSDFDMAYLFAVALYKLENPEDKNKLNAQTFAIEKILNCYDNLGETKNTSKMMQQLQKARQKQELEKYVQENYLNQ
jgi:hypothetical protein